MAEREIEVNRFQSREAVKVIVQAREVEEGDRGLGNEA